MVRVGGRDRAAAGGAGGGAGGSGGGAGGSGADDIGGAGVAGGEAGMPAEEVLAVVDWLEARGAVHVITGGWAVDALVGRATRPHRDLDVIVEAGACDGLTRWLRGRG